MALLVYILEVVVLVVRGVQDGGVHVTRRCSSFQGELIIVVGHNAGKGALGGDTHGPRAHITAGSPGLARLIRAARLEIEAERRAGVIPRRCLGRMRWLPAMVLPLLSQEAATTSVEWRKSDGKRKNLVIKE